MNLRIRDSMDSRWKASRRRSLSSGRVGRARTGLPSLANSSMAAGCPAATRSLGTQQTRLLGTELCFRDDTSIPEVGQALKLLGDAGRGGTGATGGTGDSRGAGGSAGE